MKLHWSHAALGVVLGAAMLVPADAHACGGCFVPPSESTVVTGHRMVLAVSPVRTVLWDQIAYSGDPAEFAWVLPVKPGTYIEVGSDAWFETLEAATAVQVQAPNVRCASSGGGCIFGGSVTSLASSEGFGAPTDPVQVVHKGTVGPYDTVTLSTSTPGALNTWLTTHGYGVDEGTQPIIDAYVAEELDFIALRLQPGAGVREMKPVRVISPGASPVLPLRMVAAGTGPSVSIVLYVVGEGRWAPASFPEASLPLDLLSWDFATNESNYGELRALVLGQDGGRGWLTPYAQQGALFATLGSPNSFFGAPQVFHQVFADQALANGEITEACTLPDVGGKAGKVVDPCPAGVPPDDPSCALVGASDIDARTLRCGSLDDLAVALVGMHPKDVWLTRLESSLPRAALDADLTLEPAATQTPVSNFVQARLSLHPEDFCPSVTPIVSSGDGTRTRGAFGGLALLSIALCASLGRRLARRRPSPSRLTAA